MRSSSRRTAPQTNPSPRVFLRPRSPLKSRGEVAPAFCETGLSCAAPCQWPVQDLLDHESLAQCIRGAQARAHSLRKCVGGGSRSMRRGRSWSGRSPGRTVGGLRTTRLRCRLRCDWWWRRTSRCLAAPGAPHRTLPRRPRRPRGCPLRLPHRIRCRLFPAVVDVVPWQDDASITIGRRFLHVVPVRPAQVLAGGKVLLQRQGYSPEPGFRVHASTSPAFDAPVEAVFAVR